VLSLSGDGFRFVGPRFPGFGATTSIIWQTSSIDQRGLETPVTIAGDIFGVLCTSLFPPHLQAHTVKMVRMVQEVAMLSAPKENTSWTVAGAKARLSEVIERAQSSPQTITRNGKPSVVVVSAEEWQRKTARKGTLAEFLLGSPLRGADLDLERQRDEPRDLPL
jgi:prevent-host-death family protein